MTVPDNPKPNRTYSESDLLPRAKRRRRRARNDRGLPPDEDLRNLAHEYLLRQRQHWSELAANGVLPEPTDGVLVAMVEAFKQRHRTGEAGHPHPNLKALTLGGHYARFSCDNSSPHSITDQMVNALRKAKDEGGFIAWEYIFADYSVSGLDSSRQGYSSYKQVLNSAGHSIDTTYIDDFTRASRDEVEWWKLAFLSKRLNLRLIGASDGFDVDSRDWEIQLTMYGLLSRMHIKGLREKVRRGMKGAAQRGTSLGKPPLGYSRRILHDPQGKIVYRPNGLPRTEPCIDPCTSGHVELLFELFVVKLWTADRITGHFNRLRIDDCDSWTAVGIRKLLKNPKYVGVSIWNQTRNEFDHDTEKWVKVRNPASEWEMHVDRSLAIIPLDVWKAARRRLGESRRKSPLTGRKPSRNERSATTLFSGTLFCGSCGKELVLFRSTKKYKVIGCLNGPTGVHGCQLSSTKSTRIIEKCLLGFIRDKFITDEAVEDLVEKANAYLAEEASKPQVDVRPLQQREKELKRKLQKLLDRVENADDESLLAGYDARIKQRQKELNQTRQELIAAEADTSRPVQPLDATRLKGYVKELRELLNGEIPAAAAVLRKITGPIKIRQEAHANGKRGARWIAEFQPGLLGGLLHVGRERNYPDSDTLELLSSRIWINSEAVEVVVDEVPKYEQLAPIFRAMHENGTSLTTIASAHKICQSYVREILKFAETGERPKWGSAKKRSVADTLPTRSSKRRKYVELADEVTRRHGIEGQSFEQIATELTITYGRGSDSSRSITPVRGKSSGSSPRPIARPPRYFSRRTIERTLENQLIHGKATTFMSGSAGRDARSFGIVLLAAVVICAGVTGNGGFFWILLAIGPVSLVARALDGK